MAPLDGLLPAGGGRGWEGRGLALGHPPRMEPPGLGWGVRTIPPGAGSAPEPPVQGPVAGRVRVKSRGSSCICVWKTLSQLFTRMPSVAPAPVARTAPPLAAQTPAFSSVSTPIPSPHPGASGSEAECLCCWDPLLEFRLGQADGPAPPRGSSQALGVLRPTEDQGRAAPAAGGAPGDTQPAPWSRVGGDGWWEGNSPPPKVTPRASLQQRLSGGPAFLEQSPEVGRNVPGKSQRPWQAGQGLVCGRHRAWVWVPPAGLLMAEFWGCSRGRPGALSHGAQRPGMLAVARAMTRASCGGKRWAQAGPKLPLNP